MGLDYLAWTRLLAEERLPAAIVDLDAVDANLSAIVSALDGTALTVRVASKSIRHPGLLRTLLDRGAPRLRGLMTFSAHEAAALASDGFDDLLMGYPVARRLDADVLARLVAEGVDVTAMVDLPEHCDLLEAAGAAAGVVVPCCVDVDVSWRLLGGRVHLGVRRSAVRSAADALALAQHVARRCPHVRLRGMMAYEAAVASMREVNPESRALDPVRRLIRAGSKPVAAGLRGEVRRTLAAAGFTLEVVNGGGTGSLRSTVRDGSLTEVTVGSGFLCPHLFDGVEGLALEPAAFFALPICRRSDPDHLTCLGGGYVASGEVGADRAPRVHLPEGIEQVAVEGWGEVQTAFRVIDRGLLLAVGDPIICRHAKAGELAERFGEVLLVRGGAVVDRQPTWRGRGLTFM